MSTDGNILINKCKTPENMVAKKRKTRQEKREKNTILQNIIRAENKKLIHKKTIFSNTESDNETT